MDSIEYLGRSLSREIYASARIFPGKQPKLYLLTTRQLSRATRRKLNRNQAVAMTAPALAMDYKPMLKRKGWWRGFGPCVVLSRPAMKADGIWNPEAFAATVAHELAHVAVFAADPDNFVTHAEPFIRAVAYIKARTEAKIDWADIIGGDGEYRHDPNELEASLRYEIAANEHLSIVEALEQPSTADLPTETVEVMQRDSIGRMNRVYVDRPKTTSKVIHRSQPGYLFVEG